jgi:hypothetical protein
LENAKLRESAPIAPRNCLSLASRMVEWRGYPECAAYVKRFLRPREYFASPILTRRLPTIGRSGRRFPEEAARREITNRAGIEFDPAVVSLFLSLNVITMQFHNGWLGF